MENHKEMVFIIIIAILTAAVVILGLWRWRYKRQIRSFTAAARERMDIDYNHPVTVDCFDKDVLDLAKVLNEYTDIQREIAIKYERDRKHLKNVIAGISHDFRTPLTAAKGYMQLIEKNGHLDSRDKEYLAIAMEKTNYLKGLSDEFFEISTLEAKEQNIELVQVHLNKLISECILSQYQWIEERELKTDFRLPDKDIFVMSNEHLLNRIVENLFSNAKKYTQSILRFYVTTEAGKVTLTMENDMEDSAGIDVSRVFEPFYRDRSRHNDGTGLGLYVVKCLAEQLGYELSAECTEGEFVIRLCIGKLEHKKLFSDN